MSDPAVIETSMVNIRMSSGTQATHVVVDTKESTDKLRVLLDKLLQQGKIYGYFVHKVDEKTDVETYLKWFRTQVAY
ncbi:MAG: hypothetical protein HC814_03785 [Rhodobacteraceae bacterium]|nr:hypothetical protein [Paracoccaceae bacterium]